MARFEPTTRRPAAPRGSSIRRLATALTVSAIALSACSDDTAPTLAGVVREPALEVGTVELLDVSSPDPTPVTMKAPDDGALIVYFGYTSCIDICPTTMNDIAIALNDLPKDQADRVRVAMVTVDPDRDTPEVLTGYLNSFFDESIALPLQAADTNALKAAADAFGVRYEVAEHVPGETAYDVSHSAVTYVVDDDGTVEVEWPFGFDSEQMTADLTTLLSD